MEKKSGLAAAFGDTIWRFLVEECAPSVQILQQSQQIPFHRLAADEEVLEEETCNFA